MSWTPWYFTDDHSNVTLAAHDVVEVFLCAGKVGLIFSAYNWLDDI